MVARLGAGFWIPDSLREDVGFGDDGCAGVRTCGMAFATSQ